MSQYPSPYQPPQPPTNPYGPLPYGTPAVPNLGAPARNAGLLMIIMGVLMALFAGCFVAGGFAMENNPEMTAEQQEAFELMEAQVQEQVGVGLSTVAKIGGGIVAVPAFAMVLLGLFVRRGSSVAIILGIVVTALVIFMLLMMLVGSFTGGGVDLGGLCFVVVPLALFGLQMFWLSKAIMNSGPLKVFNEQQQAYQWQMAQQARQQQQYYQQMYQQQGFNYPPPPPPPPGQQPPPQGPDQPPTQQG